MCKGSGAPEAVSKLQNESDQHHPETGDCAFPANFLHGEGEFEQTNSKGEYNKTLVER